uniref:Uncharacterized protein n=1 Tax=Rhizophora mucronata TaxID=61149 RepID=A0A2P2NNQ0_RHIMU
MVFWHLTFPFHVIITSRKQQFHYRCPPFVYFQSLLVRKL